MSEERRLLVLSPTFHGYWRAIEAAFSELGYAVRTHCYDDHRGLPAKIRVKERELRERLGQEQDTDDAATQRACAAVRDADPDILLLVKSDGFGAPLWELLEARRQRRALWLYDEVRRTRHTPQTLAAAGPIGSYSTLDVETLRAGGLPARHVPLAFDTFTEFLPRTSRATVFVGARYPSREQLLATMHGAGVPVQAYGRDWSSHPVDRLRTWRWRAMRIPSGRDLSRATAYGVMAGATATLNIHGDQDGFTMRTFEAGGVGAVQLVDRSDVHHHYDPETEVAVFGSPEEAVELARRAERDRRWAQGLRAAGRARTLAEHTFVHRARVLESLWSD